MGPIFLFFVAYISPTTQSSSLVEIIPGYFLDTNRPLFSLVDLAVVSSNYADR